MNKTDKIKQQVLPFSPDAKTFTLAQMATEIFLSDTMPDQPQDEMIHAAVALAFAIFKQVEETEKNPDAVTEEKIES